VPSIVVSFEGRAVTFQSWTVPSGRPIANMWLCGWNTSEL
jgi:hypothetical protein